MPVRPAPDASSGLDAASTSHDAAASDAGAPLRVLLFTRTEGYRHDSIEPACKALMERAERGRYRVQRTEDPAELQGALGETDVVVFLMTTGDVLDDPQQAALEAFVRGGGGFVGVHSSADTEYDWPFYRTLNGAWFADHPDIQHARLQVQRDSEPSLSFLPASWEREDEWYNFRDNPRSDQAVRVLMTLDESSYHGGKMGDDHPITWCRALDQGRSFYTGLGHTNESWQDPLFLQLVEAGLRWAGKR